MSVHSTSLHSTSLHLFTLNPTPIPLLVATFLTLFLNVFSLQRRDDSKLAGNWFQLLWSYLWSNIYRHLYSVWHNYIFISLFLLLATSFGHKRPSSNQYLQKPKNAGPYNITRQFYGIPFTFIMRIFINFLSTYLI